MAEPKKPQGPTPKRVVNVSGKAVPEKKRTQWEPPRPAAAAPLPAPAAAAPDRGMQRLVTIAGVFCLVAFTGLGIFLMLDRAKERKRETEVVQNVTPPDTRPANVPQNNPASTNTTVAPKAKPKRDPSAPPAFGPITPDPLVRGPESAPFPRLAFAEETKPPPEPVVVPPMPKEKGPPARVEDPFPKKGPRRPPAPVVRGDIVFEKNPQDAVKKAAADKKLVFVVQAPGEFDNDKFSVPEAEDFRNSVLEGMGDYLNQHFVSTVLTVPLRNPTAAKECRMAVYFCAPDREQSVLHAVADPSADSIHSEAEWIINVRQSALEESRVNKKATPVGLIKQAHIDLFFNEYDANAMKKQPKQPLGGANALGNFGNLGGFGGFPPNPFDPFNPGGVNPMPMKMPLRMPTDISEKAKVHWLIVDNSVGGLPSINKVAKRVWQDILKNP